MGDLNLWGNAHDLAHQRDIEDLRREIGALKHERDTLERALTIAHEDIADLLERVRKAGAR